MFVLGTPLTYYLCLVRGGGLSGLWLGMTLTMVLSNVWLLGVYTTRSWREVSDAIRAKAEESKARGSHDGPDALAAVLVPMADEEREALLARADEEAAAAARSISL